MKIRNAAFVSIGSYSEVKSLELQQSIFLIEMMETQVAQMKVRINPIVDTLHSPIMAVPGISYRMAATIIVETENFANFSSTEQVLAYAKLEPSVYQLEQMTSIYSCQNGETRL